MSPWDPTVKELTVAEEMAFRTENRMLQAKHAGDGTGTGPMLCAECGHRWIGWPESTCPIKGRHPVKTTAERMVDHVYDEATRQRAATTTRVVAYDEAASDPAAMLQAIAIGSGQQLDDIGRRLYVNRTATLTLPTMRLLTEDGTVGQWTDVESDESYRARLVTAVTSCRGSVHVLGPDPATWHHCQCGACDNVHAAPEGSDRPRTSEAERILEAIRPCFFCGRWRDRAKLTEHHAHLLTPKGETIDKFYACMTGTCPALADAFCRQAQHAYDDRQANRTRFDAARYTIEQRPHSDRCSFCSEVIGHSDTVRPGIILWTRQWHRNGAPEVQRAFSCAGEECQDRARQWCRESLFSTEQRSLKTNHVALVDKLRVGHEECRIRVGPGVTPKLNTASPVGLLEELTPDPNPELKDPLDEKIDGVPLRSLLAEDEGQRREDWDGYRFTPAQRNAISMHHSAQLRAKVAARDAADEARTLTIMVDRDLDEVE